MSIGRVADSLTGSSKIARAGEGGIEASTRVVGLIAGLAKAEEAEFAWERGSYGKEASSSAPTDERPGFQRAETVDMREPIREIPFIEEPEERLFSGEYTLSRQGSARSYPSE